MAMMAGGIVSLSTRICIAAVSVCLALFMLAVMGNPGEPTWWLFTLLTVAWNISPLVAARIKAARERQPSFSLLMLLFALAYVSAGGLVYYHDLYPKPAQMNGFLVILFPIAGWVGLTCLVACVDFGSLFSMVWRANRSSKSQSDH